MAELPRHILAQRQRALLAVHHLEGALGIVAAAHPVHHIERIAVQHRGDNGLLLLFVIDKLALVRGTDVELSVIASHALLIVVHITLDNFTNGHLDLLYRHHNFTGFLLRIRIRG